LVESLERLLALPDPVRRRSDSCWCWWESESIGEAAATEGVAGVETAAAAAFEAVAAPKLAAEALAGSRSANPKLTTAASRAAAAAEDLFRECACALALLRATAAAAALPLVAEEGVACIF